MTGPITSAVPSLAEHVLEVVPSVVYVLDLQTGENLFANRSIGDALGYSPDEVQSLGADLVSQLLHPDDLEAYAAHAQNLRSLQDGSNLEFEYRMRHRVTGEWRWMLSRDAVFKRRDGEVWQIIGSATDITERKRAESALVESEERYRTLFNSIDQGFCLCEMIFDEAGKPVDYLFLEVNPTFESQTGLVNSVGKTARELVPNLESHWFEMYGRVVLTGEPVRFVDGSEAMGRWFDVYALRVGAPEHHRFAVLFKDITRQRQAEDAMHASQNRLEKLFRLSPAAISLTALEDGRFVDVNERFLQDFGYGREEVVGHRSLELGMFAQPETRAALQQQLKTNGAYRDLETGYRTKNGEERVALVSAEVIELNGAPHLLAVIQDITERRNLENTARDALERLELGLQAARAGWWEWDITADTHRWSPGFERLLGLEPGEFRGGLDAYLERVHVEDRSKVNALVRRTPEIGFRRPDEYEYRVALSADTERWVASRSRVECDSEGRPSRVQGVDLDITERKRADMDLRASEERYRLLSESQKRFVADAGHELRAPLTSILGNLQLLNRFPDMPAEERQQSLIEAAREAGRLTRLVNDLLALARGDAGAQISHEAVSLHDLLRTAWREFSAHDNAHDLPTPTLEPVTVMGDADKLLQLAIILLENAVKYTPDGGTVRLSLTRHEQHAALIVADTGIGISETDLPHVFERFYRADKARVHGRDPGGTGLGLPIAQWIAQVHGGSIDLESELGRGTTVTVRLPLTPDPS